MTSPREGMMEMTDYVEIPNETGKYRLAIGKIAGTKDIYISLFVLTAHPAGFMEYGDKSEGKMGKCTFHTRIMNNGQYNVSNDESIPIARRYIEMLRNQWFNFTSVRHHLEPLVKDFMCITK